MPQRWLLLGTITNHPSLHNFNFHERFLVKRTGDYTYMVLTIYNIRWISMYNIVISSGFSWELQRSNLDSYKSPWLTTFVVPWERKLVEVRKNWPRQMQGWYKSLNPLLSLTFISLNNINLHRTHIACVQKSSPNKKHSHTTFQDSHCSMLYLGG